MRVLTPPSRLTRSTLRHNRPPPPSTAHTFTRSYPLHEQSPSSSSSTKDPSHPNLYYHSLPHPTPGRIALSFLPRPPEEGSKTILGYLPLDGGAGLGDLQEEPRFLEVLHASIRSGLEQSKADTILNEAEMRPGDGYMHVTDERALPPAGRIGETDDLIGSVFVQDGKVMASTYEPLPSYRLVTSNGPLILPKGLAEHLLEDLERIDKEEKSGLSRTR